MIVQITTPLIELWRIDGEFSNQPHVHESEYQVTVPIRGHCHFTLENKNYRLRDGGALIQHPGERHSFLADSMSGLIIFKIRREGMGGSAQRPGFEWEARQQFDPMQLSRHVRNWTDMLLGSDPCDRLIQDQAETQVIAYLTAAMTGNSLPPRPHPFSSRTSAAGKDPYMDRVLDFIHTHYREAITIDTLAGIAAQSRYHFIRSFKTSTGETPYRYVLKLRMQEALQLLRTSRLSVTEIALSLGYSSASPFYRAFINAYGLSPEQCRDQAAHR